MTTSIYVISSLENHFCYTLSEAKKDIRDCKQEIKRLGLKNVTITLYKLPGNNKLQTRGEMQEYFLNCISENNYKEL